MSVTILEALQNAEFNMRNIRALGMTLVPLIQSQIHNAAVLLEKGYDANSDEVEPLLAKYGSVEDVPEKVTKMTTETKPQSGAHPLPQDVFKYAPKWVKFAVQLRGGSIYGIDAPCAYGSAGEPVVLIHTGTICLGATDEWHFFRDSLTVREMPAPVLRPWRDHTEAPWGALIRDTGSVGTCSGILEPGRGWDFKALAVLKEWCWPHEQFTAGAWKPCGVMEEKQ